MIEKAGTMAKPAQNPSPNISNEAMNIVSSEDTEADTDSRTISMHPPVRKKKRRNKFCDAWLLDPSFMPWLAKCRNVYEARCLACDKTLQGGRSDLLRHSSSKVHCDSMAAAEILSKMDFEANEVEVKEEKYKPVTPKSKASTGTTATQTRTPECKMIPIISASKTEKPSNVAVPRKSPPLSTPLLSERPLVLTTHLVPSLPISLFKVLVEAIEVATGKPVVLLYESRNRPVAKDVADIAVLSMGTEWEDGELLPVSFCFEHHLNKYNSPCVYADVIVAKDCAPHVEDITDLRGHRCSLPDRKKQTGAAALLFNYLYARGESPAFFGNTLDADTQVATLQMVAGKQAEVGILESPVIACHKYSLPGVESVNILTSLGPLPPYRIMVKKTLSDALVKQITAYLLNIDQNKEWVDRFAPFGVTSFAKNSTKFYDQNDTKHVVTSVPYY